MSSYREAREIAALEQRLALLETQRDAWKAKSYSHWKPKMERIEAYDLWMRDQMTKHPELKEAWDSFVCFYQLAANGNRPLLEKALSETADTLAKEKGCNLCWSEEEIIKNLRGSND